MFLTDSPFVRSPIRQRARHSAVIAGVVILATTVAGPLDTVAARAPHRSAVGPAAVSARADIELAIDTTGSMGTAVEQAKADAEDLVNRIQASVPDAAFGVVQFRDSGDGLLEYQVVQSMTTSASTVSDGLALLSDGGGGDNPEAHNLVFHNSYTASPILPASALQSGTRGVPANQRVPSTKPNIRRLFGTRTVAEVAGELGWRAGSRKIVIVLSDDQPHGDLLSEGFNGCDDVSSDPHGLVTSTELDGMTEAGRTLFMVDYSGGSYLECFNSLAEVTGGRAVAAGESIADDIVSLLLTTTAPSRAHSLLEVPDGQPRLVPADGTSRTVVKLTMRDAAGKPLTLRSFKVKFRNPAGFTFSPARNAYQKATVSGGLLTDGRGEASFNVGGRQAGPVQMTIVDDLTGVSMKFPLRIELTRKVLALVQGMGSSSATRSKAWGTGSQAGTVFGWLKANGYMISGYPADAGDAGAQVVDVSWTDAPCTQGAARTLCLATIRTTANDVWWQPKAYDLGSDHPWNKIQNLFREHPIDNWGARLNTTLVTYDKLLVKQRGIHASFVVMGHSMGGQLAIRLLVTAVADSYMRSNTGLLRSLISIDGAANWTHETSFPWISLVANPAYPDDCRYPVRTTFSLDVANLNTSLVTLAYFNLGTRTAMITDASDSLVLEETARLPGPFTSSGYEAFVYRGYGDEPQKSCAHSVLLKRQSKTIKRVSDGANVHYPLVQEVLTEPRYLGPNPAK